jgi:hypothetical protein
MIIQVDEKGKEAITQLVDIALKQGGIANLNGVVEILKSIQDIPKIEEKTNVGIDA